MSSDAFLSQEIAASSPAKLRFLLIQKAVGLCSYIESQWRQKNYQAASQWVLQVQDILTELLEGVQANGDALATTISDLYVYLLKLLVTSDQNKDVEGLKALREILEIDRESWAMFVSQEVRQNVANHANESGADEAISFDLQG